MNQSTGIHCKVICQDQMRRFQFSGTEFSSLQHQVNQLLGLNREFVLKYKDNEGDMITISSTEELYCAIEISKKENGGLLRLTVFLTEPSSVNGNILPPPPPCLVPNHTEHGRDFYHHRHGHGHGGKWGHHGGRGFGCHEDGFPFEKPGCQFGGPVSSEYPPHPWKGKRCHGGELPCKNRFEKRRNKLMFKRDTLKAFLSSLEEKKELSPEEERKKQMFQAKIQRIDSVLARFFSLDPVDFPKEKQFGDNEFVNHPKFRKCHRKFEKKEKKFEKKEHKDEMKKEKTEINLSEEAKAEIITLKNQIKDMKPALWALQDQLKTKKVEGRKAFANGQSPGSLKSEIIKLKQEKRAMKEKILPLRQRIQHLKAGGK